MPDLVGNKAIETAAIEWVMELERAAGREPRDTRYAGAPADIESPPRLIEVKAFGKSNRGFELWLDALPRTKGSSVDQALGDGEDFELLLAVKRSNETPLLAAWPKKFPPLTMIGRLTMENRTAFLNRGYDHFA